MKRYGVLIAFGVLAVTPLLAIAGYAGASNERSDAAVASAATAQFHDLGAAQDAGYTIHVAELSGATCIAQAGEGAMGDHFANGSLLLDGGVIDATKPEALVYEQRNNGTYKLVALEYIVFQADWEAAGNTSPPELFGRTFDFIGSPNRYGLPPFYALHAWIWKPNTSGLLYAWNPSVSCDG
jgi:hypothetical protein